MFDLFFQYLNRKDDTIEELQPSEAYEMFKKSISNNDEFCNCEKFAIEQEIKRAVRSGKFSIKYIIRRRKLDRKSRKIILNYFRNKGYIIYYFYSYSYIRFIIKWDRWKKIK